MLYPQSANLFTWQRQPLAMQTQEPCYNTQYRGYSPTSVSEKPNSEKSYTVSGKICVAMVQLFSQLKNLRIFTIIQCKEN